MTNENKFYDTVLLFALKNILNNCTSVFIWKIRLLEVSKHPKFMEMRSSIVIAGSFSAFLLQFVEWLVVP